MNCTKHKHRLSTVSGNQFQILEATSSQFKRRFFLKSRIRLEERKKLFSNVTTFIHMLHDLSVKRYRRIHQTIDSYSNYRMFCSTKNTFYREQFRFQEEIKISFMGLLFQNECNFFYCEICFLVNKWVLHFIYLLTVILFWNIYILVYLLSQGCYGSGKNQGIRKFKQKGQENVREFFLNM